LFAAGVARRADIMTRPQIRRTGTSGLCDKPTRRSLRLKTAAILGMSAKMKHSIALLLSMFLSFAQFASPCGAQPLDKGWWVVIASMPADDASRMLADFEHFTTAAQRCGFKMFNDFSNKFVGFQPGYNVFVVGAYPSRAGAERARNELLPCLPNSYVKYAEYLGE
jgi:hypothetical protein